MRKIDRLVLQELVGPWLFGVAMFASLLMAATYLGRIADYIVQGVPAGLIGKITLLLLPAILVKTFAMAMLLASLLAFGRLSSDSEVVAMQASGASIYRMIRPVALFALLVASVAFLFNETLVPNAEKQSQALVREVAKSITAGSAQPTAQPVIEDGRLTAQIAARDYSLSKQTLSGVTIVAYDKNMNESFILMAKELKYKDRKDWRISGGAVLLSTDGRTRIVIEDEAWPSQVPTLKLKPEEIGNQQVNDPDYFSAVELWNQLLQTNINKSLTPEQYRNREYWFWNKFSLPLAAFVFGTLGAALGIRHHRTGTAAGFALAVAIMFAYMTLANFMNVYAMGGVIPSWVASFTPILLGLLASGFIMWRRNVG